MVWLILFAQVEADLSPLVEQLRFEAGSFNVTGWIFHSLYHEEGWHLVAVLFGMFLVGAPIEIRIGPRCFLILLVLCSLGTAFVASLSRWFAPESTNELARWAVYGGGTHVFACLAIRSLIPERVSVGGILERKYLDWTLILMAASGILALDNMPSRSGVKSFLIPQILGILWGGLLIYQVPKIQQIFKTRQKKKTLQKQIDQEEIKVRVNELLEKISNSGIESLTKKEKSFLEQSSKYFSKDPK